MPEDISREMANVVTAGMNTIVMPDTMPGTDSGSTTRVTTRIGLRPGPPPPRSRGNRAF